jgi:hypothetical protein
MQLSNQQKSHLSRVQKLHYAQMPIFFFRVTEKGFSLEVVVVANPNFGQRSLP